MIAISNDLSRSVKRRVIVCLWACPLPVLHVFQSLSGLMTPPEARTWELPQTARSSGVSFSGSGMLRQPADGNLDARCSEYQIVSSSVRFADLPQV